MTGSRVAWPVTDPVALLERSIGYTLGSLQLVTPDAMTRPTPCRGWDLRALLAHMHDALETLQQAVDDRFVALAPGTADRNASTDPVGALRDRACRLLGSWNAAEAGEVILVGGLPLEKGVVPAAGALEIAVHGWDVARACGHRRPIPPRLAQELLTCATFFVTDADRPGRFASAVQVGPRADAGERLLAFLGRDPR